MKTILKYIKVMAFSSLLVFSACEDMLDLGPIDNYGNSNFWKTPAQVQTYLNGIHLKLRNSSFNRQFIMGEARGGLQVTGTSSQGVSTYNDDIKGNNLSGDVTGLGSWGGIYGMIFDCNLLIQKVEGTAMHASSKEVDYMLAQAYGIRSYLYFTLYRAYGGVPLVKSVKVLDGQVTAEELYTGRAKPKEILDFVKEDLQKSLDLFAAAGKEWVNNVTWSKAATQMLGAEVYLWSAKVALGDQQPQAGDIDKAEAFLNDVKNNTRFGLEANFASVFQSNNEGNKELIFAINYADGEATSSVSNFLYAEANIVSFYDKAGVRLGADPLNIKGTAIQRYEYTLDFCKSFDDKDSRKNATFYEYYNSAGVVVGTAMRKFLGAINTTGARVYDTNEPVYRYADVLLMLAEVENMKGGDPAKYINQIRQRAFAANWDAATMSYSNSSFKDNEYAILHERDKEFVYEGKRWYDVIRMKDAVNGQPLAFDAASTYKTTPLLDVNQKYKVLWPVDKGTLGADPRLKQTPGYKVADQQEEVW